ncbi:MAG: MFS transporter, partial [Actinomycetota bacterium]
QKPDYRNLMGAQFLAQAGDGIVQAALAKFIAFGGQEGFELEGAKDPDQLLAMVLTLFVPYTIISPFLGVVIDRWDRRRLLFLANGFRGLVVLTIGLVGVNAVPEATLLVAFLLTLSSTRIVLATKGAALPETVGDSSLVEANAVSQLGGALFQLGGGGAAFVATSVLPVQPVAIVGGLVYAVGAAFGLAVRHAGEVRPKSSFGRELASVVRNIIDGLKMVGRTPKAGAAITTYFWLRYLWSFTIVGIGFVARDLLGEEDFVILALTGGAGAAGAALGFVMANRLTERVGSTAKLVLAAGGVAGAAVVLFGGLKFNVALAVLTFFLGAGFFLAKISLDTMVQEALGDDFRGRAFALYDIAYNIAWVMAAGLLKLTYSEGALNALIAGNGVVFLIGLAGIALWFKRAGLLDLTHAPKSAATVK